jgi:shikimate dehydrogenase
LNQRFAGLIGHPVRHSISPLFQQAAFNSLRIPVRYELWDTPEEELPARISGLRREEMLGANVTIPHKQHVLDLVDELDEAADVAGAANTIVNRSGRLEGYNTDIGGFVQALRSELDFHARGRRVVLLGAGGTARAVITAMASEGAASLVVLNRSGERARKLVDEMRPRAPFAIDCGPLNATGMTRIQGCDLLVNCTSVGLAASPLEHQMPVEPEALPSGTVVVDVIANPMETPFLAKARLLGHKTMGGLPMLVHQGALSFQLWTGREAPLAAMMAAAREAMQTR